MAIRTLPTAPRRTDDPDTFIANTDAWLTAIPGWTDDVNATAGLLSSIAAGGAYALPYTFSNNSVSNGVANVVAFFPNGATAAAATSVQVDMTTAGQGVTSLIQSMVTSTSVVKGTIRLVKAGDTSKWATFNVTSYTQSSGTYGTFGVTPVAQSSASPFAANDSLVLQFQRTGDKGDMPPTTQFTPVDLGAGTNVNLALGNYFLKTISANTTLTFSAPPSPGYSFIIEVTLTSGVLTLPASVTTANNSALTLTAGKTHLLGFFTSTTGAKWRMSSSVNYTT